MSKALKTKAITERVAAYKGHKNFVIINYRALKANQAVELRHQLRGNKIKMNVVKNAILRRTMEQLQIPGLDPHIKEMTAIVYGGDDPVAMAKVLFAYKTKNQVLEIRAGMVEGRLLTVDDIKVLSALPGRQQLLAQLVGTLAAPTTNLVRDLNAIVTKFVLAVKAISEKPPK